MSVRPSGRASARRLAAAGLAAVLGLTMAACSVGSDDSDSAPGAGAGQGDATGSTDGGATGEGVAEDDATTPVGPAIKLNVAKGAPAVPVSTLVKVAAETGALTSVAISSPEGELPGAISDDGVSWTASERLEPGTTYSLKAVAEADGASSQVRRTFTASPLTLDEQTYPSVAPLQGETVGVGMPVVVTFDLPVTDRAEFEKHMTVTASPAQAGSWYWLSDTTAHWRPKTYWKPGSKVAVDVDVNGVDAGNGIYGQEDRVVDFNVGKAHIYQVSAKTHDMKVFENGKLLRTLPITTGKEGFTTRSGVKVIMEKFESKRMNSETVGIPQGSSESYDIDNVQWAMRVTNSGEFIHAAPWSVGSQGYANVSHGCTGMSTDNAAWLYSISRRGDVVEYTGTDRPMTFDNGYGDWNKSFKDYQGGSAL
ncbi:Ig-like domain-containing protein [Nocardioides sp.]|uniref:L,D-transpeptidase n=1 Tax=Nocardioides sp. TaxID=35761 RepID=UPI002726F09D|nr:Ig-like domain-containing protein [Nocardioides sp.]MDO9455818.1 Ig-like domain-containing protein [Nocardioides sp.]